MKKIAINGLGRIGRAALKILLDDPELDIVAINDFYSPYQVAYHLNFDSVYRKLGNKIFYDEQHLYSAGKRIRVLNTAETAKLPWRELDVDIVLECSGKLSQKEDLEKHLQAGAKQVILSAPIKDESIPTIIFGVNNIGAEYNQQIISCASCTTNCIAPIVEIMGRRVGIKKAAMTTLHAYTASQSIVDKLSEDPRRGRAANENFIPTTTGAATVTTKILPQYKNKFNGVAVRGPIAVGSLADITFITERITSCEEINEIFKEEAGTDRYMGVVGVNTEPIVSSDIIMDPRAAVVDLTLTQVIDEDLVKVMIWYDNEWGYANQMIKTAKKITQLKAMETA